MDTQNKYCGNCKHFNNEDVAGWGWCAFNKTKTHCAQSWDCHNSTFNGWTEITPDSVGSIPDSNRIIVTDGQSYKNLQEWHLGIGTMAKYGGYYYYVLPELKIE